MNWPVDYCFIDSMTGAMRGLLGDWLPDSAVDSLIDAMVGPLIPARLGLRPKKYLTSFRNLSNF